MPRTKAVATPGTTPEASEPADQSEALAGDLAASPEVKEAVTLADAMKMIAQLQGQVQALGRNQAAQVTGEKVELPELEDVMKQAPKVSVLTKKGWYVPPVHPTDRIAKV